jgi:hypothetical protein
MRLRRPLLIFAVILPLTIAAGCSRNPGAPVGSGKPQQHHHHPPHGGTAVVLGEEEYHVELVLVQPEGKLQAFVLDDEMESFIRSSVPSIVIAATIGGIPREVLLSAVPNTETGETVGDTALFEGQADWLKTSPQFDGVLRSITIRGTLFTNVRFNFPKGNDPDG